MRSPRAHPEISQIAPRDSDGRGDAAWAGTRVGGRILALDVGDRRIGLACSDPTRLLATPIGVYRRSELSRDVEHIANLVHQYEVTKVLVGLPVNMDGSEGAQAAKTRQFGDALVRRGLNVAFCDERLSTVEATRILQGRGLKRKRIDSLVDEFAATLILESYLMRRDVSALGDGSS